MGASFNAPRHIEECCLTVCSHDLSVLLIRPPLIRMPSFKPSKAAAWGGVGGGGASRLEFSGWDTKADPVTSGRP